MKFCIQISIVVEGIYWTLNLKAYNIRMWYWTFYFYFTFCLNLLFDTMRIHSHTIGLRDLRRLLDERAPHRALRHRLPRMQAFRRQVQPAVCVPCGCQVRPCASGRSARRDSPWHDALHSLLFSDDDVLPVLRKEKLYCLSRNILDYHGFTCPSSDLHPHTTASRDRHKVWRWKPRSGGRFADSRETGWG